MAVSATFEFLGVPVVCTGYVYKGHRTHDDFMPDEVYVESAQIGDKDITQWLDYFPSFLTACEEALDNAA